MSQADIGMEICISSAYIHCVYGVRKYPASVNFISHILTYSWLQLIGMDRINELSGTIEDIVIDSP